MIPNYAIELFRQYTKGGNLIHNHPDQSPPSDVDINNILLLGLNTVSAVNALSDYIFDFSDIQNKEIVCNELMNTITQLQDDFQNGKIEDEYERNIKILQYFIKKYSGVFRVEYNEEI